MKRNILIKNDRLNFEDVMHVCLKEPYRTFIFCSSLFTCLYQTVSLPFSNNFDQKYQNIFQFYNFIIQFQPVE